MTLVTREFLKWNIWGREVIISSVYKHAEDLSPNFYKNKANVKGSGEKNNNKKITKVTVSAGNNLKVYVHSWLAFLWDTKFLEPAR